VVGGDGRLTKPAVMNKNCRRGGEEGTCGKKIQANEARQGKFPVQTKSVDNQEFSAECNRKGQYECSRNKVI